MTAAPAGLHRAGSGASPAATRDIFATINRGH